MMINLGLPGLLLILVVSAIIVVPFWRILPVFGISRWVSLVSVVPPAPLILLWVLAFSAPVDRKGQST